MVSLDKLSTAPVLSLVGAVVASIATATGLATGLGLTPFWTDVSVALVLLLLAGYWTLLTVRAAKPSAAVGFASQSPPPTHAGWLSRRVLPSASVAVALLCAGAWFLYAPSKLLVEPAWKMCGSIVGGCSPALCIVPLDSRSRPLDFGCVAPLDTSGYIELTPRDRTTYRPALIKIQCQGKDTAIGRPPESFFAAACDGRMVLP